MRYRSKQALVRDIEDEFKALQALLESIPRTRHAEGEVWGDGWSVNDLVAHLAEWHRLFLGWHQDGLNGLTPRMPAPGYKWNQTPDLNREIWRKHRDREAGELWSELERSHEEVLKLTNGSTEEELLSHGAFEWTGNNALVTYLGANTASHYRFASKVLKRWLKRNPEGAARSGAKST